MISFFKKSSNYFFAVEHDINLENKNISKLNWLFGDSTLLRAQCTATMSNSIRGVFAGGGSYPSSQSNIIDYIQIMTTGNAQDFGDRTVSKYGCGVASNGHGGIG